MENLEKVYIAYQPILIKNISRLENSYVKLISTTIDESVQNIFLASTKILSADDQQSLKDFEQLYLHKSNTVNEISKSINDEVDNIFDEIQNQLKSGDEVSIEETDEEKVKRLSIAGYQKHLEAKYTSETNLQDNLSGFLMELQCHDLISQMLDHTTHTFKILSELLIARLPAYSLSDEFDFGPTLCSMFKLFTEKRERAIFSRHFLRTTDIKGKTVLPNNLSLLMPYSEFTDLYINFHKKILFIVHKIAERTVLYISSQLEHLLSEASRLSSFSPESLDAMQSANTQIFNSKPGDEDQMKAVKTIANELKNVDISQSDFSEKIFSILSALQFQDRISQNIENLSAILFLFQQTLYYRKHSDILSVFDPNKKDFYPFAKLASQHTTMKSERDIILQIFSA